MLRAKVRSQNNLKSRNADIPMPAFFRTLKGIKPSLWLLNAPLKITRYSPISNFMFAWKFPVQFSISKNYNKNCKNLFF